MTLCIGLLLGCGGGLRTPTGSPGQGTPEEPPRTAPEPEYARGRIYLSFVEGTLKPEAQALIASYHLPILSWTPPDFTYANIRVLQGNRAEYIPRLEAHPQIGFVKLVAGTEDQLQIYFYSPDQRNLKIEEVEAILRVFDHLELVKDEVYYRFMQIDMAQVLVPDGQERQWIQTFEQHPIVKRGDLVHFFYTTR